MITLVAAALLVAAPTLFTSCDDDPWYDDDYNPWWSDYYDGDYDWNDNYYDNGGNSGDQRTTVYDEAEVLQGEWEGSMVYTNGDNGKRSSFYANMIFSRNNRNAIKGTGTEYDYTLDSNGNVAETNGPLKFNWYIDEQTGDIHIKYLTQNMSTFVMDASAKQHGFYIDENAGTFSGYMLGTNNKDMIYIDLKRVQNNEAKKLTRAATTVTTFGSPSVTPVTFGKQSLTTRR